MALTEKVEVGLLESDGLRELVTLAVRHPELEKEVLPDVLSEIVIVELKHSVELGDREGEADKLPVVQ